MKDAYYNAFIQIWLVLAGAIQLFDNEGASIYTLLRDQEKEDLMTAMDSMGEAMYWARGIAHDALLHELNPRHSPCGE